MNFKKFAAGLLAAAVAFTSFPAVAWAGTDGGNTPHTVEYDAPQGGGTYVKAVGFSGSNSNSAFISSFMVNEAGYDEDSAEITKTQAAWATTPNLMMVAVAGLPTGNGSPDQWGLCLSGDMMSVNQQADNDKSSYLLSDGSIGAGGEGVGFVIFSVNDAYVEHLAGGLAGEYEVQAWYTDHSAQDISSDADCKAALNGEKLWFSIYGVTANSSTTYYASVDDLTISTDSSIEGIVDGVITVSEGATLTVPSWLMIYDGTLINNGELVNNGEIDLVGSIKNNGVYTEGSSAYIKDAGEITSVPGATFTLNPSTEEGATGIKLNGVPVTEGRIKWSTATVTFANIDPSDSSKVGECSGLLFTAESTVPSFTTGYTPAGTATAKQYFVTESQIDSGVTHAKRGPINLDHDKWVIVGIGVDGQVNTSWKDADDNDVAIGDAIAFTDCKATYTAVWDGSGEGGSESEEGGGIGGGGENPTGTPTPDPTATPEPSPTPDPTGTPVPEPSGEPSPTETPLPTPESDPAGDLDPTADPTAGKTAQGDPVVTEEGGVKTTEQANTDGSKTTIVEDSNTNTVTTTVEESTGDKTIQTTSMNPSTGYQTDTIKEEKANGDFVEKTVEKTPTGEVVSEKTSSQTSDASTGYVTTTEGTKDANGSTFTEKTEAPNKDFESKTYEKDANGNVIKYTEESKKTDSTTGSVTESAATSYASGNSSSTVVKSDKDGNVENVSEIKVEGSVRTETVAEGNSDGSTVTLTGFAATPIVKTNAKKAFDADLAELAVPESINGIGGKIYTVTGIGEKAFAANTFGTVFIPASILSIGKEAFADTGATEVFLAGKVTAKMFGKNAFKNCGIKKKGKGLTFYTADKKSMKQMKKALKKTGVPKAKVTVAN